MLRVSGTGALDYLQGQCSQDLADLATGSARDSLVLSPQGKLDALIRVTRLGDEEYLVDVAGGYGDELEARLNRFKLRVKAVIERSDWSCVALRGPGSADLVDLGSPSNGADVIVPYSWNGVVGVDIIGEDPEIPTRARPCSWQAFEALRVEAGIPQMGSELDGRTIAAEADLLERCVSFTKGCYTGQELVARLDARGNRVSRRLRGLVLARGDASANAPSGVGAAGRSPSSGLVGSEVLLGDKVVGSVTSAAWSPSLGAIVALGYLHRDVVPPCEVLVKASAMSGASDEAMLTAEARELPLV
jgi:folate-binding protein YgfZ